MRSHIVTAEGGRDHAADSSQIRTAKQGLSLVRVALRKQRPLLETNCSTKPPKVICSVHDMSDTLQNQIRDARPASLPLCCQVGTENVAVKA